MDGAAQSLTSWTDDVPVCKASGLGLATNELYRKDGRRTEMHHMEDRSFHFSVEEFGLCVYGVFDGFDGYEVADFAVKKLPAELLLGQLSKHSADEAVKEALRQAFLSLDREYFDNIGGVLATRLADPSNPNLAKLEAEILTGASAAVAVVLGGQRLFVANAGDTKVVVCYLVTDESEGEIKALPLSVDHLTSNEDELLRLTHLGVTDTSQLTYTRCLGCHKVKGGYKEVAGLASSKDEPVLGCPEIHGGFRLEAIHLFMLMYTRPLAKCLEQILSPDLDVATELCKITKEQLAENTTVGGVAQSVVDKVVRMHRDHFQDQMEGKDTCQRDDISLLVTNFNGVLKKKKPSSSGDLSTTMKPSLVTRSSTTTESSDVCVKHDKELSVDASGRIKPYVDFSHFHRQWQKYKESQTNGV